MNAHQPVTTCRHGDRVRYIGRSDRDFHVEHGAEYTVFGDYHPTTINGASDETGKLSIYVPDPNYDFGGVVSLPVTEFTPLK